MKTILQKIIRVILFIGLLASGLAQPTPPPPSAASQTEVNAGVVKNKYVSPFTLNGWSGGGGGGGVTSVNGKTGVVTLVASDVGAAHTPPIPSASRSIYVNKGGNDGTADGTPGLPFLTVEAALASISDASSSKIYAVQIGPGVFTENELNVPNWVFLYGSGSGGAEGSGADALTAITGNPINFAAGGGTPDCVVANMRLPSRIVCPTGGPRLLVLNCSGASVDLRGGSHCTVIGGTGNWLVYYQTVVKFLNGSGYIETGFSSTVEISNWNSLVDGAKFYDNVGLPNVTVTITDSRFSAINVAGNTLTLNVQHGVTPGDVITVDSGSPTINFEGSGGSVPVQTQIVYVSKGGNDGTATGSLALPFLTVKAAVDSIVDSTATKGYSVMIGPGEYTEADFTVPNNVNLVGGFTSADIYPNASTSTVLIPSGSTLTLTFPTDSSGINALQNIKSSGDVSIQVGTDTGAFLSLFSCGGTWKLYGDAPIYVVESNLNLGCFNLQTEIIRSWVGSISTNTTTVDQAVIDVYHSYYGTADIAPDTGKFIYFYLRESIGGTINLTGDGAWLRTDKPSVVLTTINVLGGTPTQIFFPVKYVPATPGDWAGTPPTTLEEAIDRLAANALTPP